MYHGADMTGVGTQPVRDTDKYYCLFFIAFIIVGSFFVMNLFVGVTIDKFNEMKEAQQGEEHFSHAGAGELGSDPEDHCVDPTKEESSPTKYGVQTRHL